MVEVATRIKSDKTGSKRYRKAINSFDRAKIYSIDEAVKILKGFAKVKFDETVEVVVLLGIDPKKTDQLVRGAVSLPKGLGKKVRVIVFAEGEAAKQAEQAGADFVGAADLAKKISDGWMDFDVVLATPDMMKHVGALGKVLGPQGKMPSPKSGTVTPAIANAVKEFKAGKIEFRTDAAGNVHVPIGKKSFSEEDLQENIKAFLHHLHGLRPSKAKGEFFRAVSISSTMSPGIKVNSGLVSE